MRQHNPDAAMPPDRGSYGIDLSGSNISPLPGLDVMPKAPAMTSIDRLGANTVRVTWKPAADHPDQVLLMERKPFYSSEIGLWHPYTFRHDVQVGATSMDRKLERDSDIPLRPVRMPTGSVSSRTASSATCAPRSPSPSSHNPSPAAGRSATRDRAVRRPYRSPVEPHSPRHRRIPVALARARTCGSGHCEPPPLPAPTGPAGET